MDIDKLIAIDIHTHAEVSCWNPFDNCGEEYDRAADRYFRSSRRPTIEETITCYREQKIGPGDVHHRLGGEPRQAPHSQ